MTFRFYLQPTMASIAALHDGIRDARFGHKAFFWTVALDPTKRGGPAARGTPVDGAHRALGSQHGRDLPAPVLHRFYPVEAVLMAILLAVVPYFVFRWIVEGASRWWFARHQAGSQA